MKYLISLLITISLFVMLLFSTIPSKALQTGIVSVPYQFLTASEKKEVDCLADNIWFEAGYEPKDGQLAVGLVTLNRVKSKVFDSSVCGVVHQKTKSTCQFTWLCEGKKVLTARQNELYENAREIALYVYFNHAVIEDLTGGAIYYHADYVSPKWNKLKRTTQIGRHIFYIDPKVKPTYDGKT